MISLMDSRIIDILPDSLTYSPEMEALSYAVSQSVKKLLFYCSSIGVYSVLDGIPENMLAMLALELNTPCYDEGFTIKKKRELIKNTLQWHKKAGTLAAVEEFVKAVFMDCCVQEWYQYGGEPYTFKVQAVIENSGLTEDIDRKIEKNIQLLKNVRSHCSGICYKLGAGKGNVKTGAALKLGGDIKVKPYIVKHIKADASGSIRAYLREDSQIVIGKEI